MEEVRCNQSVSSCLLLSSKNVFSELLRLVRCSATITAICLGYMVFFIFLPRVSPFGACCAINGVVEGRSWLISIWSPYPTQRLSSGVGWKTSVCGRHYGETKRTMQSVLSLTDPSTHSFPMCHCSGPARSLTNQLNYLSLSGPLCIYPEFQLLLSPF